MTRKTAISFAVLAVSLVAAAYSRPAFAAETVELFDGTNLDHFYTYLRDRGRDTDPNGVFSVQDGELVITGEEWGCITTKEEYANYHLVAEYKWAGPTHPPREDNTRDSGILLHSIGPDGGYNDTWMHSIECQIIEGGTGDFIVVGDGSESFAVTAPVAGEKQGSSYVYDPQGESVTIHSGRINWFDRDPDWTDELGFRGANDLENPVGQWNRLECFVFGQTITIVLNGTVVNQATDVQPRKGRIQIQSEAAEIVFRRIVLTDYDSPGSVADDE